MMLYIVCGLGAAAIFIAGYLTGRNGVYRKSGNCMGQAYDCARRWGRMILGDIYEETIFVCSGCDRQGELFRRVMALVHDEASDYMPVGASRSAEILGMRRSAGESAWQFRNRILMRWFGPLWESENRTGIE